VRVHRESCVAPAIDVENFPEQVGWIKAGSIEGRDGGAAFGGRADNDVGAVGGDVVLDGYAGIRADLLSAWQVTTGPERRSGDVFRAHHLPILGA
jgi:hypothetical protein